MKPDTIRTASAVACVAMALTFAVLLFCGGTVPALIVTAGIGAFFLFVGITQPV